MTPQEQKEIADNLIINVFDNPSVVACNIVDHFNENFVTGISLIDTIKVETYQDHSVSGIYVKDVELNETLFSLEKGDALLLNSFTAWLIEYLDIEISY